MGLLESFKSGIQEAKAEVGRKGPNKTAKQAGFDLAYPPAFIIAKTRHFIERTILKRRPKGPQK